jgi:hypothetical protein
MPSIPTEFEELRIHIERLRTLLETLVVRGLRACGPDEMAQLQSYAEHLQQAGAGHVAAVLLELRQNIEKDDRASARTLLRAQTSVRVLERLLTLRVVKGQYDAAKGAAEAGVTADIGDDANADDDTDEE